jgi:thiamine-monophosphate kinase
VQTGAAGSGLGPGVEFDRIRSLLEQARVSLPSHVRVGPGDDAAVVEGTSLVVSTDLSVEDVHFRRDWVTPEEIGFRAVSAALSDLAAMAASPLGVLVSVALPASEGTRTWDELGAGVASACERAHAPLVGGDLSASPGPLVLDVTVLGQAASPVLRSGAVPGDEIWVTGALGGSGGAVRLWEEGLQPPEELRQSYAHPTPRIAEARWLARQGDLHALIDLSDGLQGDAAHLAAASDVEVTLDLFRLPVHPRLRGLFGERVATELALTGGEDYELCFAAPPGSVEGHAAAFPGEFGVDLTRVGTVGAGSGVYLRARPGEAGRRTDTGAFDHFAGDASE